MHVTLNEAEKDVPCGELVGNRMYNVIAEISH